MTDLIPRPRRIGIVLNPESGHVRRHLADIRQRAGSVPHSSVIEATSPEAITAALASFALTSDDLLVVIGGDGTLQAALTAMLATQPLQAPQVLIMPAGTTNMSAADMGARMKPAAALNALSGWINNGNDAPSASPRAVLQVFDGTPASFQCGMFFGAGAIISGVRYFHSNVSPTGVRGVLGPSLAFVRMLLSLIRRREHPLLPATRASLHLPQRTISGDWLLILATTLDTLLLGSTPYWGVENAPLHFTAIAHRPPRLVPTLFSLLRGKTNATMKNSQAYVSHNLADTTLDELNEYLLDGEIFSIHGPLRLSASAPVRFICY